jgi:UDP-3-O-[3-hydroxymyristoyl] N-acetylglucosamine deacetylase
MNFQQTLKQSVSLQGIGLHSGKPVTVTLHPGSVDRGIVFVRTDAPYQVAASYRNIVSTQLATVLGLNQTSIVSTVEHLLAALYGAGVSNAVVELDASELPAMDGSALAFYEAILKAGVESQFKKQSYLVIRKKIEIQMGESWAFVEPCSEWKIHGSIDWDHACIGYQECFFEEGKTSMDMLLPARTFGFLAQEKLLKARGLALGASLENTVVLDQQKFLNPEGLRFSNEFVRHKVLDALGDFMLAGYPMRAFVRLHRGGHEMHRRLLVEIFENPSCYEIVHGLPSYLSRQVLLTSSGSQAFVPRVSG